MDGRQRFGLHGIWCELDAAGLRAWLLANTAAFWSVGIPLDGLGDDLPRRQARSRSPTKPVASPLSSSDREIVDEVRYLRAWTPARNPGR